jgi:hypothetical protein
MISIKVKRGHVTSPSNIFSILLIYSILTTPIFAEETPSPIKNESKDMPLQIPLGEFPFNYNEGFSFPGMEQSLHYNITTETIIHESIGSYLEKQIGTGYTFVAIALFDMMVMTYLPPGSAWLHEEWHRAVMANRGIDSYNEVYEFNFFSSTIAVSHVHDDDLIRLKRDHPADMVRLSEAGIEAQYESVKRSRENYFFSGRDIHYVMPGWWLNIINSVFYIQLCTTSESNSMTNEMNIEEEIIEDRDFVGLDFTAWVYDLHRPDEPYEDRGVHLHGNGIDRYIKNSDLTDEEKKYLDRMFYLSLMNFVSPQLFGIKYFSMNNPLGAGTLHYNAAMMHYLTSFGYTVDLHIMLKIKEYNLTLIPRLYANQENYLPGFEIGLYRYSLNLAGVTFYWNQSIILWLQPENSGFYSEEISPGGLIKESFAIPLNDTVELYLSGEMKTEGWVAGFVELDRAWRVVSGVVYNY